MLEDNTDFDPGQPKGSKVKARTILLIVVVVAFGLFLLQNTQEVRILVHVHRGPRAAVAGDRGGRAAGPGRRVVDGSLRTGQGADEQAALALGHRFDLGLLPQHPVTQAHLGATHRVQAGRREPTERTTEPVVDLVPQHAALIRQ